MNPSDIHILVIDDEAPTRLLISRQLQREGYQVAIASSGSEGLDYLNQHWVNVIFLDLLMPGLSGYQVLEHLKADPSLASISVIIVSAIDDLKDIIRCLDMGADDYILKPVNPLLLNIRLHTCLERQWLRQQEQRYLYQLRAERDSAERANRARSAFLANMSHELRTPLNAVIGYTDILQDEFEDEGHSKYLSDLAKIRSASQHLLNLIGDILDISKLESDQMEVSLESFVLGSFVEQVWSEVRSLANLNQNTLSLDLNVPEDTPLYSDRGKLRQILLNVLNNALKFTTQGTIQFIIDWDERSPSQTWLRFKVIDTGIGIPPEQQERIFEPFTQVDDSSTRVYGGTGLGLAICHRLSQLLGGDIHLASTVNKGTTITLRLPTQITSDEAIASRYTPRTAGLSHANQDLVIVIDGDRTVRDWMVEQLNQEGYRVVTSWSGQDGIRLIRELHPSIVWLGSSLPDGSSWATLKALKDDPWLMNIPVVLHSLSIEAGASTLHGQVLGACHMLTKPEHYPHILRLLAPYVSDPKTQSVLLVQPPCPARDMLERLLIRHGWTIHTTPTLAETIAAVQQESPTAIILDPLMVDSSNVERWASLQARSPQIPILYVWTQDIPWLDEGDQVFGSLAHAPDTLIDSSPNHASIASHLQALTRTYG
ncbi:MAG: response regulator [Synechococcales cyanobacterium T60_A2020_003]|nr:response regulator [Synechococcales cyanobacterium T60_A2020_003]